MDIMYLSQMRGRPKALATAIFKLYPGRSFQYVADINMAEKIPDCEWIVIVGNPEFIFDSEKKYQDFLDKANESKVKVAGISITKERASFPNNNKGIGKFILAGRGTIKDFVKELSDFFEEG